MCLMTSIKNLYDELCNIKNILHSTRDRIFMLFGISKCLFVFHVNSLVILLTMYNKYYNTYNSLTSNEIIIKDIRVHK